MKYSTVSEEIMKIALIIKDLRHCGAQRAISRLSFVLEEAGYEIYMVMLTAGEIDYPHDGKLILVGSPIEDGILRKIKNTIIRTLELRKIKKEYNFDAAISFLDTPNISNILSRQKEKVFVSVRNFKSLEDSGIFGFLNRIMIKMLYPKADKIIVVSKAIAADMEVNYNIPREKITVIYNPFDIEQIQSQSNEELPDDYRNFYNGHRVIISVGRLDHQKGYCNLLKAFSYLKTKCPDTRLVLIGDGEQTGQLEELTKALNIENDVLFAGYQKNPFSFIRNAHVYVLSSLFEGFPNAMVEAMACGVPVVSTDCKSGPREILYELPDLSRDADGIEYADYGIISPVFDTEDNWDYTVISDKQKIFAEAIAILLNDHALHQKYSQKAFERVKSFTFDICRRQYIELLADKAK